MRCLLNVVIVKSGFDSLTLDAFLHDCSFEVIWQAMFNNEPFIAAGAKFSCTGTDGHISPFYLRVEGEPDFNSETNVVTLAVRPSHFTEMIYGHAHLEQGMAENGIPAEAAEQAAQNSTGSRRSATEFPLGASLAKSF